jgi:hypothetical protein
MKRFLFLAVILLALPGCRPAPEPRTLTDAGVTAVFGMTPEPPRVGHDSGFSVTLTEGGRPVTGATVNFAFFFRGLNQTGPTAVGTEASPGVYEAREISTGMGGKWEAEIAVTRPAGAPARFTFPFTVSK